MKKEIIFNESIRLRDSLLLLIVIVMLSSTATDAQTIQSSHYRIPNHNCNDVIIRESSKGTPVISYHSHSSPYGAKFMYGDLNSGTVKEFIIYDTNTAANNTISYAVNDMRVVGDMCYFCGIRVYTHGEPDPETGGVLKDSVGILGRFPLNPSGFGGSVKFDLKHFHETKCLSRMATYVYGTDTLLAIIGIVNQPTSQSCLTVARVNGLNSWQYNVLYSNVSATMDVFTDIAIDAQMTTIASYQKANGGRDHFCLRSSRNFMLDFDTYTDLDNLYKYSVSPLTTNDTCVRLVRPEYADVRLSAVPWEKKVYAAFMTSEDSCPTSPYRTAMCEIQTSDMLINNAQVVQRLYRDSHSLVDMKYLYRTFGTEVGASVALLHLADDNYNTIVEYPNALVSSYSGVVPKVLVQMHGKNRMSSVSAYGGNVRFGGVWEVSAPVLTCLQEDLPSVYSNSQCMVNCDADIMTVGGPQGPQTLYSQLQRLYFDMSDLEWDTKTSSTTTVTVTNVCSY